MVKAVGHMSGEPIQNGPQHTGGPITAAAWQGIQTAFGLSKKEERLAKKGFTKVPKKPRISAKVEKLPRNWKKNRKKLLEKKLK